MNQIATSGTVPYSSRDIWLLGLYLVTSIVAVVGNIFVCVTIYRKKRLESTTYILIFNMAVSDILGGIVIPAQWLACSTWSLESGSFGSVSCGLFKLLQILSYYISSLTMVAISYDRYRLICKPLASRVNVTWLLLIVWILGLVCISQMFIILRLAEYFSPNKGLITCRVIWVPEMNVRHKKTFRLYRYYIHLCSQYIIPLIMITIFYSLVMHRIWFREQIAGANCDNRRQQFDQKKRQTIKMLIFVTALFGISYLPVQVWHFIMFTTNLIPKSQTSCYTSTLYMLSYWLAISSCALNPFIYCYFNAEMSREAVRYWRIFVTCGKPQKPEVEESGLGASSVAETISDKTNVELKPMTQVEPPPEQEHQIAV